MSTDQSNPGHRTDKTSLTAAEMEDVQSQSVSVPRLGQEWFETTRRLRLLSSSSETGRERMMSSSSSSAGLMDFLDRCDDDYDSDYFDFIYQSIYILN